MPRRWPGKQNANDLDEHADTPWSAAEALRLADTLLARPAIDRRAEPGAAEPAGAEIDDLGTLAGAFAFIDSSSAGAPLPAELAARLGAELGVDLRQVRIHDDERAAQATRGLGARAFTIGQEIFFAPGAYDPTSVAGLELLVHELAHVAQNLRGATGRRGVSRPGDAHEVEADQVAQRIAGVGDDPAALVEKVRRDGQRLTLPFITELEQQLGTRLDFVEAYTGDAARVACELMAAGAFAVRNVVAFADPSPQREQLLHELAHVIQMGSTAPAQFRPGSLRIGDADAPAEHDARAVAVGARVGTTADPNVIHRDDKKPVPPWTEAEALKRWNTFQASLPMATPTGSKGVFGAGDDTVFTFYQVTCAAPFTLATYKASVFPAGTQDLDPNGRDLKDLHKSQWATLGLVQVTAEGAGRWAYVAPGESPKKVVQLLIELEAEKKTVTEKYDDYCAALDKLPKVTKPSVTFKNKAVANFTKAGAKPVTEPQLGECRDALKKAVAAVPDYHWKNGQWDVFYAEVIEKAVFSGYNAIQGDIFADIAATDIGGSIVRAETAFYSDSFEKPAVDGKKKRAGDGFTINGTTINAIVDFKSGPGDPGNAAGATPSMDDPELHRAARDYAKIVGPPPMTAHSVDPAKRYTGFTHVLYVLPNDKMATAWATKLKPYFKEGVLQTYPPSGVDGVGTIDVGINPTFQVALANKTATSHTLTAPPMTHPGMSFKSVTVNTKAPGSTEVTGGQVLFDLALGGAFSAQAVPKPLTAKGGNKGQVEDNSFAALTSQIDKILKGAKTSAKITETGVEASIEISSTTKIGKITLLGTTLTATYDKSGKLTVGGEVKLAYDGTKITGSLGVTYDGSSWGFKGKAKVEKGMVDGLDEFTCDVAYESGKWSFGVDKVSYTKTIKAVTLTGQAFGVRYDVDAGSFSGMIRLDADLGMFGKASGSATLEKNKLGACEFAYDSPELKYPAKSEKPAFVGTVGGTLTYKEGRFSGAFRGGANLKVPGLAKLAKDGVGLAVDARVNADGSYGGTIKSTSPLTIGKFVKIPNVSLKLAEDGAVSGTFGLEIGGIKFLERGKAEFEVNKDGIKVKSVDIKGTIGTKDTGKYWGSLEGSYSEADGLKIGGSLSLKIKEGMVATGTLLFDIEKGEVDAGLKIEKITLLEKTGVKKQLIKPISKKFPIVNVYGIGIYVELGFSLDFGMDFLLHVSPSLKLNKLNSKTWDYESIEGKLALGGELTAALTGTPKVGLGLFAGSPDLISGGGGLEIPITAKAVAKPSGDFKVTYKPDGGVDGAATVGMALNFGITGAVRPYAGISVLNGLWSYDWKGEDLAKFTILEDKELFKHVVDFGGDMTKKEPKATEGSQPASAPVADKVIAPEKPAEGGASVGGGGSTDKKAAPSGDAVSGNKPADDELKLGSMVDGILAKPGLATIKKWFDKAGAAWGAMKDFFGRVAKAFSSWFDKLTSAAEAVIDGFAKEGLGYLPKLIKLIVGDSVYEVIAPIVELVAKSGEQILELFETNPPKSFDDFFPWSLRLLQKALSISVTSVGSMASAIRQVMTNLKGAATKLVTKMVTDGMVGVKRHQYYIWTPWPFENVYFLAATEWKVNAFGYTNGGREDGAMNSADSAVGIALFTVLEEMGVPSTNNAWDDKAKDTYRDRWGGK